ncbi:MAG: DUF1116 domain-containing protein [Oscillospiraceae bacterium]
MLTKNPLFGKKLSVINTGSEHFYNGESDTENIHVDWAPEAGGDEALVAALDVLDNPVPSTLTEKIAEANARAVSLLDKAQPVLCGVSRAGRCVPGINKTTFLHAGPPIKEFADMAQPLRDSIVGAILFEELAANEAQALQLAESGRLTFDSASDHRAVCEFAGVISSSMPMYVVENRTCGNFVYAPVGMGLRDNISLGKKDRRTLENVLYAEHSLFPVLEAVLADYGDIPLLPLIDKALFMGDDLSYSFAASSMLFANALAPCIVAAPFSDSLKKELLQFIAGDERAFANLALAAFKSALDAVSGIKYCTLVTAIARNGREGGIKISGLSDKWFTAPLAPPHSLQVGFDVGDTSLAECFGLGAYALPSAYAPAKAFGETLEKACRRSISSYEIFAGKSTRITLPIDEFDGVPLGLDLRKIVKTNINPIYCADWVSFDGTQPVHAGELRELSFSCFADALRGCEEQWEIAEN